VDVCSEERPESRSGEGGSAGLISRTGQEEVTGSIPQGLPDVIQSAGMDALLRVSPAPTWNSLPFDQVPA
jgi:hypothetical protein